MKKKTVLILFILLVLIQISIPLSMITKRELALKSGTQYKFRTMPVDPYDAFRGRYVMVRVQLEGVPVSDDMEINYGKKVYALLQSDSNGYGVISEIQNQPPKSRDYLCVRVINIDRNIEAQTYKVSVLLPFDRYYMEEKMAPAAEDVYRNRVNDAYVTIRVRNGFGVVEQLYVGQEKIEEYLKRL